MPRAVRGSFAVIANVFLVGMALPARPVALPTDVTHPADNPLVPLPVFDALPYALWLTRLGVAFFLVTLSLIEWYDIDRKNFAFGAVLLPWTFVIGMLFVTLLLHPDAQIPRGPNADVYRTMTGSGQILRYAFVYTLTGLGAVVASRLLSDGIAVEDG